jgi:hypothetical protein
MANNITSPFIVSDGIGSIGCVVANPATSYTVGAEDNVVIAGANSLAITLAATSNSPVYISSVDGTTQRTGTTIVANGANYVIADNGCAAYCIRYGSASANKWAIIGAKTAS